MIKDIQELLDLEFIDWDVDIERIRKEYILNIKDASIIYYALKHYLRDITASGGSMSRITRSVELANLFKDDAKIYLDMLIKKLKDQGNQSEETNIKNIEQELKSELEN